MRTLTPILSIIIAVLLFMFFIQPQYAEIQSVKNEIKTYTDATAQYAGFSALLQDKLSVKTQRSAYESERLDTLVPDSVDATRLLVDLEKIATTHGLLFGNITTKGGDVMLARGTDGAVDAPESAELATVDVSFAVIGTYDQFKDFLKDLERSVTLFEVTEIKYSVTEESVLQQFSLTVRSYSLPQSE